MSEIWKIIAVSHFSTARSFRRCPRRDHGSIGGDVAIDPANPIDDVGDGMLVASQRLVDTDGRGPVVGAAAARLLLPARPLDQAGQGDIALQRSERLVVGDLLAPLEASLRAPELVRREQFFDLVPEFLPARQFGLRLLVARAPHHWVSGTRTTSISSKVSSGRDDALQIRDLGLRRPGLPLAFGHRRPAARDARRHAAGRPVAVRRDQEVGAAGRIGPHRRARRRRGPANPAARGGRRWGPSRMCSTKFRRDRKPVDAHGFIAIGFIAIAAAATANDGAGCRSLRSSLRRRLRGSLSRSLRKPLGRPAS